jgi:hypothetical protein
MYYANISYIKDQLREYMLRSVRISTPGGVQDMEAAAAAADWPLPRAKPGAEETGAVRYVILDMTPVRLLRRRTRLALCNFVYLHLLSGHFDRTTRVGN